MAKCIDNNFSDLQNLCLEDSLGIQFTGRSSDPTDGELAAGRLYYETSVGLRLYDGSSWSTLGTGGGGSSSWDSIYSADKTLTINSTTLTFELTHATNNGLTLTGSAGSAGHVLVISNSGSGDDIYGTGGLWSVTAAGLATFATNSVIGGILKVGSGSAAGTVKSNGNYDLIVKTGNSTSSDITITDGAAGDITATLDTTGKFVITGTTTHNDSLQVAQGDVVITTGSLTMTDDQNANSFSLTNGSATTIGVASATGIVNIVSDSLTTGVAVNVTLTEGTLAGGYYFRAWDTTAGSAVWSVGESGAVVAAGEAVGTTVFTLTAGDFLMSDGNVAITSTGTTDVVSITDDALLANNALIVKGSGAFTGVTTSSFVAITPTGLSTGTALYIAAAAATTASVLADFTTSTTTGTALRLVTSGVQVDGAATGILTMVADSATTAGATAGRGLVSLSADALTTGTGVDVTSTSITLTTAQLLNVSHISGSITGTLNCTSAGIAAFDASRTVTTGTVADDYDLGSFIRTQVINGAGSFSAAGSVLYVQNITTNTSGTITDTVKGIEVVMDADGAGDGVSITHSSTTGKALNITTSGTTVAGAVLITANAITSGNAILVNANGVVDGQAVKIAHTTSVITTGSVMQISSTGVDTGTGQGTLLDLVSSGAQAATIMALTTADLRTGTGFLMTANSNSLTSGVVLSIASTGTGLTTGSLLRVSTGTTGAVATNGVVSIRATGAYTSTSNAGLVDVSASATTAGTIVNILGNALTTGYALNISSGAGVYTGTGLITVTATAATTGTILNMSVAGLTQGKAISIANADALTTGSIIDIRSNSADATARKLLYVENTNASATGCVPLSMKQVAPTSTNYYKMTTYVTAAGTVTLWIGAGTTANGTLSGTAGDICLNGGSNKPEYCTGGTTWVALV